MLDIQYALNSDIMMVLDDLVGLPAPKERIIEDLSSARVFGQNKPYISFAPKIIGQCKNKSSLCNRARRALSIYNYARSALSLTDMQDFDGYAIGGLAVGESAQEMYETMGIYNPYLPPKQTTIPYGCWDTRKISLDP